LRHREKDERSDCRSTSTSVADAADKMSTEFMANAVDMRVTFLPRYQFITFDEEEVEVM